MWNSGDYASALGLCISCLNIESEYLPGKDAAYVKTETDTIIEQAATYLERSQHLKSTSRPAGGAEQRPS